MKAKQLVIAGSLIFLVTFTLSASAARADWLIDRSGTLIQVSGDVLGEETEVVEPAETEVTEDPANQKQEAARLKEVKMRTEAKHKLQSDIDRRVKAKVLNGQKSRIDLKSDGKALMVRQELLTKDDKLIRESETEINEGESLQVENENGEKIEIKAARRDELELKKSEVRARSKLPLSVGEKNEISVTLPNGKEKVVALPDRALQNLVDKGILTSVTTAEGETPQYELTTGSNGEPVYATEGQVEKKLLGIFKMRFKHDVEVAASDDQAAGTEVGEIVGSTSKETSTWRRLLERFSR